MNRLLYPILGLLIVIATVVQVSATRTPKVATPQATAKLETPRVVAEGRVVTYPGAEVTVGTDVAGTIERLNVDEKQQVRAGEVIAIIRADDTRAALSVARARVGEAQADTRLFEAEVARAQHLFREDVGSKQAWDKAERDLDSARARAASASAEVRRLEALVEKTVITAPIDGIVITRHVRPNPSAVTSTGAPRRTRAVSNSSISASTRVFSRFATVTMASPVSMVSPACT